MNLDTIQVLSNGWEDTLCIGRKLSTLFRSGDVVTLTGDLGSGKTLLTRGICEGLDVQDRVTSPTFTIIQEYSGRLPVYHFDFYRMKNVAEIEALDIDFYLNQPGVSIIEWAERADSLIGEDRFHVAFSWVMSGLHYLENQRRLEISAPVNRRIGLLNL